MKKFVLFLSLISFFGTTALKAQLCLAPTNLKASCGSGNQYVLNVLWTGPVANYRVYYTPSLNAQAFTKDVTNATSTSISKMAADELSSCQQFHVWVRRLDCPNTGMVGPSSDTIVVDVLPLVKFSLTRDTGVAYHWFLIDSSQGKPPFTYLWMWGDGNTSTGATPSHTYASSGTYDICLALTDSFGCSHTFCDSSFYIYRLEESSSPVTIDVVKSIPTKVATVIPEKKEMKIYPNPCSTCQVTGIENEKDIVITDILGRIITVPLVMVADGYQIQLPATGIFLLKNQKTGEVVKIIRQ